MKGDFGFLVGGGRGGAAACVAGDKLCTVHTQGFSLTGSEKVNGRKPLLLRAPARVCKCQRAIG